MQDVRNMAILVRSRMLILVAKGLAVDLDTIYRTVFLEQECLLMVINTPDEEILLHLKKRFFGIHDFHSRIEVRISTEIYFEWLLIIQKLRFMQDVRNMAYLSKVGC